MPSMQRYHRQEILPEIGKAGQEALLASRVLIVGAGGLGCPLYQTLSAAGVGRIGIVDGDVVSESNLARQTLFAPSDINKPKVEVIQQHAAHFHPDLQLDVFGTYLDTNNAFEIISQYDVVLDGTDNFLAQYLINDACVLANKPWVFASILRYEMQVSTFNYQQGPTYRCLYPTPPKVDVPSCSDAGVISTLPPLAANLQANECLKILLNIGQTLSGVLWQINALTNEWNELFFDKNIEIEIKDLTRIKEIENMCNSPEIQEMAWQDAKNRLSDFHLLDVRTDQEFNAFNIGGEHISLQEIAADEQITVESTKPVLVMCAGGVRSVAAIELLQNRSPQTEFYNLTGGLQTIN